MALTGNTVQSTYLDLVQLEQSGAGLPSHAGKEAALYDGSGAQIVGRTAQRHWLDPHPDAAAFAETFEFSTTGDMTQGQLETAGWTFENCTGVVTNGILWLSCTGGSSVVRRAYLTVSYAGDFDIMACPQPPFDYAIHENTTDYNGHLLGVGDTTGGTITHSVYLINSTSANYSCQSLMTGTWAALGGTGASRSSTRSPLAFRIHRVSGTIYIGVGSAETSMIMPDLPVDDRWGWQLSNASDASTYNRLFFSMRNTAVNKTSKQGWLFLRRFQ